MKLRRTLLQGPFHTAIRLTAPLACGAGLVHAVPVALTARADLSVSENATDTGGLGAVSGATAGDGPSLNVRFTNTNRNEILVLRFDLSSFDRAAITAASVNLVNYAANNATTYRLWGVLDGATGLNSDPALPAPVEGTGTDDDWPESGTTFSNTPGLEFDANSKTRGHLTTRSVNLGTSSPASTAEGTEAVLSTAALRDFLVAHEDGVVTILISAETVNTGLKRFASKEATTLLSGGTAQPAGTFAPRLVIDLPGQRIAAEADAELTETTTGATGLGDAAAVNARWVYIDPLSSSNRNDVVALRFNLAGVDRAGILGAQIRLTNFRDNTAITPLQFHGVADGATGYNATTATEGTATDDNWPETATTFATMPGLEYDADLATAGVRGDRTTDLGTVPTSSALGNFNKGTRVSLSSDSLIQFLKNHPDDVVTVLVVDPDKANAGQKRFASREATLLDGDVEPQPAGTYAPELNLLLAATPPAADFRITGFSGGPGAGNISLTWLSKPGETYSVTYSKTLADGFSTTVTSGIPATGAATTYVFPNPAPAEPALFFRVRKP